MGQDGRPRRPARRRDVRRDVRLPAGHGPEPPARDHDERHRDDLLPADRARARCRATSAPSASFVGGVAAIRAQGGDSAEVTGAILVAGVVLAARRRARSTSSAPAVLHKVLPPVVTGAVVMLIGFNLAPVVASIYWPQDQWVALLDDDLHDRRARSALRGFSAASRSSSRLIFGYVLSWLFDKVFGQITSFDRGRRQGHHPLPGQPRPASPTPPGSASRRTPTIGRRQGGRRLAHPELLARLRSCWCCRPSSR